MIFKNIFFAIQMFNLNWTAVGLYVVILIKIRRSWKMSTLYGEGFLQRRVDSL